MSGLDRRTALSKVCEDSLQVRRFFTYASSCSSDMSTTRGVESKVEIGQESGDCGKFGIAESVVGIFDLAVTKFLCEKVEEEAGKVLEETVLGVDNLHELIVFVGTGEGGFDYGLGVGEEEFGEFTHLAPTFRECEGRLQHVERRLL